MIPGLIISAWRKQRGSQSGCAPGQSLIHMMTSWQEDLSLTLLTFQPVVHPGRCLSMMAEVSESQLACLAQVREVYERAIANVPPAPEKRYWQRYIYLWIRYALWEELEAEDAERTRQVYKACLNLIPHSIFTFAKVRPFF